MSLLLPRKKSSIHQGDIHPLSYFFKKGLPDFCFDFFNKGAVLGAKSFDTCGLSSAGVALRDYLNAINGE